MVSVAFIASQISSYNFMRDRNMQSKNIKELYDFGKNLKFGPILNLLR